MLRKSENELDPTSELMKLGYNTNGFAFHDPYDVIKILNEIGYQSIAITIDQNWLNPFASESQKQLETLRSQLSEISMSSVIETGARFLLDPRQKHQPTLLSIDDDKRQLRIDFLKKCIDIAKELGSDCVSLWSGFPDDFCDAQTALDRLGESLKPVCDHAAANQVLIGFEPEPGMFVETTGGYERLCRWIESDYLKLTMDIGHLFCLGEVPIADYIKRFENDIVNIHIEDMKAGVHEHLLFGDGDISFPPVLKALKKIEYTGGLHVELSRHSHDAVEVARQSYKFLSSILQGNTESSI